MEMHQTALDSASQEGSPTRRLLFWLAFTLLIIVSFCAYAVREVHLLRRMQADVIEKNRRDSLQLIRIQSDLFSLAMALRDIVAQTEPYPIAAWRNTFDRIRYDLGQAILLERSLAPVGRPAGQHEQLLGSIDRFWATADEVFRLAQTGREKDARQLVQSRLQTQHMEVLGLVSRLLVHNNQVEEEAARHIDQIYRRVQKEIYVLGFLLLFTVVVTGAYLIASNRRAFESVTHLSEQLRVLSWRMIRMQEELLHTISRELHDEFGQIATAMGTLLGRAKRGLPAESPLVADLVEVQSIAQQTLDRIRTQARLLHPVILDDFGLDKTLQWYVDQFSHQSGVQAGYVSEAVGFVSEHTAIHIYRIVQEALNNISRHSASTFAWVRLKHVGDFFELEIEDRGKGLPVDLAPDATIVGMGLIGMRERAELMGGKLSLQRPSDGGLLVSVRIPCREVVVRPVPLQARAQRPAATTLVQAAAGGGPSAVRRSSPSRDRQGAGASNK